MRRLSGDGLSLRRSNGVLHRWITLAFSAERTFKLGSDAVWFGYMDDERDGDMSGRVMREMDRVMRECRRLQVVVNVGVYSVIM